MLKLEQKQLSLYASLYNKIPENHILKLINSAVDFSFINELMKPFYVEHYGRPAKEPEMMCKLSILQYLYSQSDEQIIIETELNLGYKWFVGLNPEEDLPDPSLLCKFRKQRIGEDTLDEIIKEVIRQCVAKGIIKGTGISIDSTHAEANTVKKVPKRIMKQLAKKIMQNLEEEKGALPENIDKDIPNYKLIEDHAAAKKVMEGYLEKLIDDTESRIHPDEAPKTQEVLDKAKKILEDPKFLQQKGIRSLVDEDARVGYKSKTDSFFGYKSEIAMIVEERIITAVNVYDGAYVDGREFKNLYNQTEDCGISIRNAYADKAYFRQPILDLLEQKGVNIYIPASESVYKMDEEKYSYNKDSDQWFCQRGNSTIKKERFERKKKDKSDSYYRYSFEKETCKNCPSRDECVKGSRIAKILEIRVHTPKFYAYSQQEKTEEFKEEYKKRACHEGKNGEMKRFHGMDRARGYGLRSMQIQAKFTALAVNLKRIANLVSSSFKKLPIYWGRI